MKFPLFDDDFVEKFISEAVEDFLETVGWVSSEEETEETEPSAIHE